MTKPQWVVLVPATEDMPATWGMNIPGGCIIDRAFSPVMVTGITIVQDHSGQVGFESTAADDMNRALEPIRELIALFCGAQSMNRSPIS
jgi:hypothetical protein